MDQFLELKEIFIGGGLQQPQTSWFCSVKEPFLEIEGEVPEPENNTFHLDFGSVSPLEPVHQWLEIANLTQQPVMIWIKEYDDFVSVQWENGCDEILLEGFGGLGKLQVTFNGSDVKEQQLKKIITLAAEMDSGARKEIYLQVRIQVIIDFPYGCFSFNGTPSLIPHYFGQIDPTVPGNHAVKPYTLSIDNRGREPLSCSLAQLPRWLTVKVAKKTASPSPSTFQVKPGQNTAVTFLPRAEKEFLGPQKEVVQFSCNDIRPTYRELTFEFSVLQEIQGAYVTFAEPVQLEVVTGKTVEFKIPLKNWGKNVAHISQVNKNDPFRIQERFVIPMAENNTPYTMDLPVKIDAAGLEPGDKRLELELSIHESRQQNPVIPIEVSVIGIQAEPGEIDFGEVDPVLGATKTVHFRATDGRDINIMARPVKDLTNYLKVSLTGLDAFEVRIALKSSVSLPSPPHYEGPGIEVFDPDMNYRTLLPVKFRFCNPKVGKLCKKCLLVSEQEIPFCSGCGNNIKNAKMILEDEVVICPECRRKYSSELSFCRLDGNRLQQLQK